MLDTSLYGNEIKLLIKLHSCCNDVKLNKIIRRSQCAFKMSFLRNDLNVTRQKLRNLGRTYLLLVFCR